MMKTKMGCRMRRINTTDSHVHFSDPLFIHESINRPSIRPFVKLWFISSNPFLNLTNLHTCMLIRAFVVCVCVCKCVCINVCVNMQHQNHSCWLHKVLITVSCIKGQWTTWEPWWVELNCNLKMWIINNKIVKHLKVEHKIDKKKKKEKTSKG